MTLAELADRCEQATGPDRRLDIEIVVAVDWREPDWEEGERTAKELADKHGTAWLAERAEGGMTVWRNLPRFTASLDAAMTLATEDLSFWFILQEAAKRCALANEANTEAEFRKRLPAFVCAAALRARSA